MASSRLALLPSLLLLLSSPLTQSKPQGDAVFFPGSHANVGGNVEGNVDAKEAQFVQPQSSTRSSLRRRPAMAEGFAESCAGWGALPYYDDQERKWVCHYVGDQGPCPDGYWFVLDKALSADGQPQGICRKWDCGEENVYKMVETNQCAERETSIDCPRGMEVLVDPFGLGKCECVRGHVPFQGAGEDQMRCYPQYLQGPCGDGEQLVQVDVFFQPGKGPCQDGEQLVDVSNVFGQSPSATACLKHHCPPGQIRWENGLCVDSIECPIAEDRVVLVSEGLTCDIATRQIIRLGKTCPEGKGLGPNGKCIPLVDFGSSARKRTPGVRVASGGGGLERFLSERFKN